MTNNILEGTCEYGKFNIKVNPGDGNYVKCEVISYCSIFGKEYSEIAYDDDINIAIRQSATKLIDRLNKIFK